MISPLLSFLPSYFQHDPLGLFLVVSATGLAFIFFQSNIIQAFESYVDEHKQAFINSAKRLDGVVGESE